MGPTAWIDEHPETPSSIQDVPPPSYRPRRTHTKSRKGCQNCKQRRIKCDESTPICGQCSHRRVHCDLIGVQAMSREPQESAIEQIMSHLKETKFPYSPIAKPAYRPSDSLELLNHFIEPGSPWIGSPQCHRIMQQHGLQLSLTAPYFLHAILASSASHLSFLFPGERRYEIAATLHYEASLRAFSKKLRTSTDANNADSLVGCSYLHAILALWNVQLVDDTSDNESTSASDGGGLTWLRAMRGVGILWDTQDLRSFLPKSIWYPVCMESGHLDNATCNHSVLEEGNSRFAATSEALHQLCDVPFDSALPGNLYQKPLKSLCFLIRCDIGQDKMGMFMFFLGQLPYAFIQLLDQKEPKAMLILCYWTAILSQIDQWVSLSAKLECTRLCKLLDGIEDWRIRELLRWPSEICGYLMKNSI